MCIKYNKWLFSLIFVALFRVLNAQFSVQPHLVFPTGYLGMVLKKAPGLMFGKISEFKGSWRSRAIGDIVYFKPREDVFRTYAVQIEGSNTTVFPGEQIIKLYLNVSFSFGADFKLYDFKKGSFYIGADLVVGSTLRKLEINVPSITTGSEFNALIFIGVNGRAGVEFYLGEKTLFIDVSRRYFLNTDPAFLNYNDIGLGLIF
ncbi:MAG: hypothetical protein COA33_012015 [Fluviicola sp.]|nr:hypothetical protein [Fluviicola sp.]